jgi:xylan 1,4-beta-xylosidase
MLMSKDVSKGMLVRSRAGAAASRVRVLVSCLRAFVCALALCVAVSAQRRASYTNPVVAGDFPDPSVTRVGRDYWAATTSSEWGPEYPIFHSRDLVNWQLAGTVFRRPPAWSEGNYWAPEISQDRGRFFVYYAAHKKGGPLCVAVATAARPNGPYTDHGPLVCQEVGSIDPFPVTDENGRRYLLWKEDGNSRSQPTPIWAQALSADGTRLVGERRELIRNDQAWEKHPTLPYGNLVEGPSVVRRNGWFYLFYSGNFCCARECSYALGVARSRKLLGPWEKSPANPILAGNDEWKCPGHGTVIADERGRYFLLYHSYSTRDFVYVGRQALLDEVVFGANGWPTINGGRGPSGRSASPYGAGATGDRNSFFDDFIAARLAKGWQWPQSNEPEARIEPARGGWLALKPTTAHIADPLGAVLARTTTTGDYVATTAIDTHSLVAGASAGLSAYGDGENALGISVAADGGARVWRREKNQEQIVVAPPITFRSARAFLRMTAREGHLYRFALSEDGRRWTDAGGEVDGSYLPPWDRGVRVALVSTGAGARFDWLRISPSHR